MPKASQNPAEALRAVPPREFVRTRNALAAKLAMDGKAADAREIRRLPRPSPVVWALNRTAVDRSRGLNTLVHAVDGLRRAQLGQGEPRAATERYRAAFEPLVRNAVAALLEAGSAVSPAIERRIRSTLLAAITDRRLRGDLATGRLAGELTEPGFSVLSRGPIPAEFLRDQPAKAKPAAVHKATATRVDHAAQLEAPSRRRQRKREEAEERRRAQQADRHARHATRQAQREVSALRRDARQKERAAQDAENKVGAVRKALQKVEQEAVARRAMADQAREAAVKAEEQARAATRRTD